MTPESLRRLEALFAGAAPLAGHARATYLAEHLRHEPELEARLEALLAAHDRHGATHEGTLFCTEVSGASEPQPATTSAGPYRLLKKIGEGGMGEVYLAERADGAFDRRVAVKLMRAAIDHEAGQRRFLRERQILAALHHPNIVTLLDGGVTDRHVPYLVMELAQGTTVTNYCNTHRLGLRARIELMRVVCDAVAHAHQHAVVHRDLKPANVLVLDDGTPKVCDFGVAKLLAEPLDDGATRAMLEVPVTPNYASPEQLLGTTVTTASDVYALGVLVYEVVAGVRPYETRGAALDQVLQLAVHSDPPMPSEAMRGTQADERPYGPDRVAGDVDVIVMKALSKDPAARYRSAGELAADLARFVARRPVEARLPTPMYLFRRFASRHRTLVSGLAAATVAVAAAMGAAVWQRQLALDAQRRAEHRFEQVRTLANRVLFDYQNRLRLMAGASDLRARMATDSLAYLDALAADRVEDVELRADLANGYMAVATMQGGTRDLNVGDTRAALASLAKAEGIIADVVASGKASARTLYAFARFGCVASRIDTARAAAYAHRCLKDMQPQLAGVPRDDARWLGLGEAYLRLAEAGESQHAGAAIAIFEQFVNHPSEGRRALQSLSLTQRVKGWAALADGDLATATHAAEAALTAMQRVVEIDASGTWGEHAFTMQLLGWVRMTKGEAQRGADDFEHAILLMRTAHGANLKDALIQDRLARLYYEAATAVEAFDAPRAARWYREGVGLLPSLTDAVPTPLLQKARAMLYAGDARLNHPVPPCSLLERARDAFNKIAPHPPTDSELGAQAKWIERALVGCSNRSVG